jgi:hypothetical protein
MLFEIHLKIFELITQNLKVVHSDGNSRERDRPASTTEELQDTCCVVKCLHLLTT